MIERLLFGKLKKLPINNFKFFELKSASINFASPYKTTTMKLLQFKPIVFALILANSYGYGQTGSVKSKKTKKSPVVFSDVASETTIPAREKDTILMQIGGDPVTKREFESIYRKNNKNDNSEDRKALEEYLELFINFKLKVKAARDLGKDTAKAFINELKGYRKQLAQPYLTDKDVNQKLIEEAYQRMKKDVHAGHLLIKLSEDALPKDTLAAWNKIIEIRNKIIKGENFEKLAKEFSDDPSAKQNAGDLGYFTAMMMVYPFESAAYNTPVGQVSMPVRTKFGYHLLKVYDIRDARGQVHVAHIMIQVPETAPDSVVENSRKKAEEIYQKIIAGEDFGKLASNYSDDRTSGRNGGELPWFGTNRMVLEFENAAFELKEKGDVSKPVRSQFGFHIIKLLDKKGIQTFDEAKGEIKYKISKDSRSQLSRNSVITRIKKENNFSEDFKALDQLVEKVDTSYLSGKWSIEKVSGLNKTLFTLGIEKTTQQEFAKYISDNQTVQKKDALPETLVRKAYAAFRDNKIISYEDVRLEEKYPEFRLLMQEYHDGILLFDITNELVWDKAIKDSAGLAEFHEKNKNNYLWGDRIEAAIYKSKDEKTAKAVRKLVNKRNKKGYSIDFIKKKINKNSELNLQTEEGIFSKGDNETIDKLKWVQGLSLDEKTNDGLIVFVEVIRLVPPGPKSLPEAKGLITSDYQTFLEKQWIKVLKAKYQVKVDEEVFKTIR